MFYESEVVIVKIQVPIEKEVKGKIQEKFEIKHVELYFHFQRKLNQRRWKKCKKIGISERNNKENQGKDKILEASGTNSCLL